MTWNVWGRFGTRWQRRHRTIAETIKAQGPTLVALQESWAVGKLRQADVLGAELRMSSAFAVTRMPRDPDPEVELGVAILSRYPLLRAEQHALSDETVALRAEIRLGDRSLHFLTTCFDWEEDRERLEQADRLAALASSLSASGDPVVVAGDLNAPPDRPEIKRLLAVLSDCRPEPDPCAGHTYSSRNPHLGTGEWLEDQRIDYILSTTPPPSEPLAPRSWLAGLAENGDHPPSDHYAVLADVPLITPHRFSD
ncbi:endonuclease/exonuclease/phosphatase family protein [Kribbella sp. NPDC050470]